MTPWGSKNKYGAKKTSYKGHTYDSRKEAKYAEILDDLKKKKLIKGWERQVRFKLPSLDWFETQQKRSWYSADFVVETVDGRKHVVEVKGVLTDTNKIKYAFFKYLYERPLHIIPTTGLVAMNTEFLECTRCPHE